MVYVSIVSIKNKLYKMWLQSKSHNDEIKYKDYKKVYTKSY